MGEGEQPVVITIKVALGLGLSSYPSQKYKG